MRINIKPLNNNRTELYQWDTDRQIEITPDDGIVVDEIHYATVMLRESLVVLPHVVDGTYVADIPNILLQSANTIHIYVVTHTANGERTIDDTTLGVIRRKKPSDYVYTETEVMRYMYKAGEYMIYNGIVYVCKTDTNYSPDDLPEVWEQED